MRTQAHPLADSRAADRKTVCLLLTNAIPAHRTKISDNIEAQKHPSQSQKGTQPQHQWLITHAPLEPTNSQAQLLYLLQLAAENTPLLFTGELASFSEEHRSTGALAVLSSN
jgi:hypothetical protein